MKKTNPNFDVNNYFNSQSNPIHKQYNAMQAYFIDKMTAAEVAEKFGYTVSTVYSMARDLKKRLTDSPQNDPFFQAVTYGRKPLDPDGRILEIIVTLRKNFMSIPEIKAILDAKGIAVSITYITEILRKEGFARLPRRDKESKQNVKLEIPKKMIAIKTKVLDFEAERFTSQHAGLLCLIPFIVMYEIDKVILNSKYPQTNSLNRLCGILCFLALKLSNIQRYSMDDLWCMDRGMGLFAGVNVLPKTAWYSSYSSGVTREMNLDFLKSLHAVWKKHDLLGDTVNLDFTTIPYWGNDDSLENNWSGKRNKALALMLALLAQDPDTGIICYGDTTIRHENQNESVLEFLDFYRTNNKPLHYLVFDSKVTTYKNLNELNKNGIKFITIRRRSAKLVEYIDAINKSKWKKVRIERSDGKGRNVLIYEETTTIKDYDGELRQIYLTGTGKIKPAIIITNDMEMPVKEIIRKYSKRWLVETEISEHIEFFHLNRNSSGMVIKVDFDLTMTILAHNIYRLFAQGLIGFSHCEAQTLFNKFIDNAGEVWIDNNLITVHLKKKRNLPLLLEILHNLKLNPCSWLNNLDLSFVSSTTT